MRVEFRWEDILNHQIRRRERLELDANRFVRFPLGELAPTENLRVLVLDSDEHGEVLAELLLER